MTKHRAEALQAAEIVKIRRFAEKLNELPPEVYPTILKTMKAMQAAIVNEEE